MGWTGGIDIMDSIVECLQKEIEDADKRKNIYIKIIKILEGEDWDTLCECQNKDKAFKKAVKELYPEWEF